ncbi:MAG: antitoxin [Candidatus Aminicenantes bacterium]|nr:MAG: antitoxin [Candidatus Aminicenantes bacterium]
MKIRKDEKELLDSVERGEWVTIPDVREEARRYKKYAQATFRKDKRLNIRISEKDLTKLQKRALQEGLPYQTFISSILHKFITGQLKEKSP